MKNIKEILSYVAIILVVILIRTFIATPVKVDGLSMYPTLNDKEILILKKFDKSIERFEYYWYRWTVQKPFNTRDGLERRLKNV